MNDVYMTSHRPYLLRALYEWIADNGMTPHILIDASVPGVRVPKHIIGDGRVILNIAERAVARLQMDNEQISFSARFGGATHQVRVPVNAVLAIYARETGQGMALPAEVESRQQPAQDAAGSLTSSRPSAPVAAVPDIGDNNVLADSSGWTDSPEDGSEPPPPSPLPAAPKGRAHLRVVK